MELKVGSVTVTVIETPGHTPESVCLVITDSEKSPEPWAVMTGDTLFIGDVGRPDLSASHTPQQLAALLYDSLHQKLLRLPDSVLVYPAHGAGSLCGRNMRAERWSTIGTERLTNYALQIPTREEFVRQLTSNLPSRPEYFSQDAEINRSGAAPLTDRPPLAAFSPAELHEMMRKNVNVLDVRSGEEFAAGHIPGSINIALAGQFASWAGTILGLNAKPLLVAATDAQIEEAKMRLARVGIEDLRGYLEGGIAAWKAAGLPLATTEQISVQELAQRLGEGRIQILDVRRPGECSAGYIAGARVSELDSFRRELPQVDDSVPQAIHCKSGYRSMIACSLLQKAGCKNVINVNGGFDAWNAAGLPVATGQL
jgi:rhodanese-related sulfurtransferase